MPIGVEPIISKQVPLPLV